ncbi:MAG: hypothetical protein SWJ54_24360 [Cyanobacteriota bacterium]|nr:hypothetical protein [Cyanobacteriota bacterium]
MFPVGEKKYEAGVATIGGKDAIVRLLFVATRELYKHSMATMLE